LSPSPPVTDTTVQPHAKDEDQYDGQPEAGHRQPISDVTIVAAGTRAVRGAYGQSTRADFRRWWRSPWLLRSARRASETVPGSRPARRSEPPDRPPQVPRAGRSTRSGHIGTRKGSLKPSCSRSCSNPFGCGRGPSISATGSPALTWEMAKVRKLTPAGGWTPVVKQAPEACT